METKFEIIVSVMLIKAGPENYSRRKNNCHFMITKGEFILRGSYFCEEYRS